jgi:hypothetical protein
MATVDPYFRQSDSPTTNSNVVGGPAETPWPKNVGLLFFSEAPETFSPAPRSTSYGFPRAQVATALTRKSSRDRWRA